MVHYSTRGGNQDVHHAVETAASVWFHELNLLLLEAFLTGHELHSELGALKTLKPVIKVWLAR